MAWSLSAAAVRRCVAKTSLRCLNTSARSQQQAAVRVDSSSRATRLATLKASLQSGPELQDFAELPPDVIRRTDFGDSKDPPKPSWLRISTPKAENRANLQRLTNDVKKLNLATVCEEAKCPNIGECWGGKEGTATATIMLMGDTCTRGCSFCAVKTARNPAPLDPDEPLNTAEAVARWGLDYVVLTSVDRDDLADAGAAHLSETVQHLKRLKPSLLVEVLTPDFGGNADLVSIMASSGLDVFAHNLETVERCTPRVRDRRAGYQQTLAVLRAAKAANSALITKTSLMLGVGETPDEIRQTMRDCRDAGVDVITFGQYLRPSKRHLPVAEYVTPEAFEQWQTEAEDMGFLYVASGPLVRSSYKAGELFLENVIKQRRQAAAE